MQLGIYLHGNVCFAVIVRFIQLIICSKCSPGVTSDIYSDSRGHSHLSNVWWRGGKRVHNLAASSARLTGVLVPDSI